jgi:hypothetical protein
VLPAGVRGSIETRAGGRFPDVWAGMQGELANACPGKKLCVGHALVPDPKIVSEKDCYVDNVGNKRGISVPDPLYEGGKITFRVNNTKNCTKG